MLYLENPANVFSPWTGQDIDGIRHPRDIEALWTPEQLEAIRLFAPAHDEVPEGKRIASSTVQRVNGVVKFVDTYEDIPVVVPDYVTKLALVRSLRAAGREAEFWTALNAAPEETRTDWELATAIARTDPLVLGFAQALSITSEELDAIFVAASPT